MSGRDQAYLGVNGQCRIPTIWWNDLGNAILCAFGSDFTHVLHGVFELFQRRSECGRFWNIM